MLSPERRSEATRAIAEHLRTVGARAWTPVRARFPDVNERTWWRLVARVKASPPEAERVRSIRRRLRSLRKDAVIEHAAAQVPRRNELTPGQIAAVSSADADMIVRAQRLYREAESLRDFACATDAEGRTRITSPKTLAVSIRVRRELLETCLKLMERAYDLERTREFYDVLIAELREESQELVARVAARMTAVGERWGLSAGFMAG